MDMTGVPYKLPFPPSTNKLYRNVSGRGRVMTTKYKQWRKLADNLLILQGVGKTVEGPFMATVIHPSKCRTWNMDIDNRVKAALDCLERCGAIANDKHCESLLVYWSDELHTDSHVIITPCEKGENHGRLLPDRGAV